MIVPKSGRTASLVVRLTGLRLTIQPKGSPWCGNENESARFVVLLIKKTKDSLVRQGMQ